MARVIIAGSRTITDYETLTSAIDRASFAIDEVVSGTADGVDTLGEEWATKNDVPVTRFPPSDYEEEAEEQDMPATLVRNVAMAEYADKLISVWDGESPGTEHMIETARRHSITPLIHRTDHTRLDDF